MNESETPDTGEPHDGLGLGAALTPRAVITGFLLVVVFAVLAPINDGLLQNTFFYSHHLTLSVSFFIVVMGVLINPLLGRFRYRSGEMMVMVGMLLVLGGVASSGLVRLLAPVMAGQGPADIDGADVICGCRWHSASAGGALHRHARAWVARHQ